MGASASIPLEDNEFISKEKVMELSGDYWDEAEWKTICNAEDMKSIRGDVWNEKVSEFVAQLNKKNCLDGETSTQHNKSWRRPGLDERVFENEEWCFVVGSLANPACIQQHRLQPISSVAALLHGYHIAFVSSNAVLYKSRGASCHGVLHKVRKHELHIIDTTMNTLCYGSLSLKRVKANVFQYNGIEVDCWIHVLDQENINRQQDIMYLVKNATSASEKKDEAKDSENKTGLRDSHDFGDDDISKSDIHEFDMNEIVSTSNSLEAIAASRNMDTLLDGVVAGGISANTDISAFSALSYIKDASKMLGHSGGASADKIDDTLVWRPEQRVMETLIQGYVTFGLNAAYVEWLRQNIQTTPRLTYDQFHFFEIPNSSSSPSLVLVKDSEEQHHLTDDTTMKNVVLPLPIMTEEEVIAENNKIRSSKASRGEFVTCCNGKVLLFRPPIKQPNDAMLKKDAKPFPNDNEVQDQKKYGDNIDIYPAVGDSTLSTLLIDQVSDLFGGKDAELILCRDQYDPRYGVEERVELMSDEHRSSLEDSLKRSPIGSYLTMIAWRGDVPSVD